MLLSLFAVLCLAVPTVDALDVPAQSMSREACVEVGIRLTPTQFRARNYSSGSRILLFKSADSSEIACRPLPAGAELVYSFARDSLDGIDLEIAVRNARGWYGTGALSLAALLAHQADFVWVQNAGARSLVWLQNGTELALLEPRGRILPPPIKQTTDDVFDDAPIPVPMHVPVITPSDTPKGDSPPKLEQKPLPPV